MNLLQMSLSGAVMILVIVVIRALVINKLPKKTFLALWGVAVVRLMIPYSFCSAFSVYSLLEQSAPLTETVKDMSTVAFTPVAPIDNMSPLPGTSAGNTAAAFVNPWMVIWVVGALACAVFFGMAYLKCHREFQVSLPVDNDYVKGWLGEHRSYRTIEIRQSGRISTPLTYGVFRPVILMPKNADWDDLDTLKYVLAHEYVHIRRFDTVIKLVLTVTLCIHWFNPAVWIMYVLANRDIELSCDETVIRQFGEHTKSAYAMTLIRMEETRSRLDPLCNNFSKNAIEERIIAIMKIKKTSIVAWIVATALVVGVTTAFATSAKANENLSNAQSDTISDTSGIVTEGIPTANDFSLYASYGLVWDEEEKALFWNGERVRYFLDGVDMDGMGTMAIRLEYTDAEFVGDIDVHTVRQRVQNADGSFDPMGPLTGLEKYSQAEYDFNTLCVAAALEATTYTTQEISRELEKTEALLQTYVPFGLSYETDTTTGEISMSWQGKPVHSVFDVKNGVWIANSMRGLYLGPDALDLEAVYEQGELICLQEMQSHATTEISVMAEGNTAESGTSFAERFEKYAPFGITYVEAEGASGTGNVYYNGQLVSRFVDLTPDGGAFTFSSAEQGNFTAKTVYDSDGSLIGIEIVGD